MSDGKSGAGGEQREEMVYGEDLVRGVASLLSHIQRAQVEFALEHQKLQPIALRVCNYIVFRALARVFGIAQSIDDPALVGEINDWADGIEVRTGGLEDIAVKPKATA